MELSQVSTTDFGLLDCFYDKRKRQGATLPNSRRLDAVFQRTYILSQEVSEMQEGIKHYCVCNNGHVFDDPVPMIGPDGQPDYRYWICPVCGQGFEDITEVSGNEDHE